MSTMGQVIYNFMSFEILSERADDAPEDVASERFTILIRDGGRLSTHSQTTIEGATAALAARAAHGPVEVSSTRVSSDEVEIYVTRRSD